MILLFNCMSNLHWESRVLRFLCHIRSWPTHLKLYMCSHPSNPPPQWCLSVCHFYFTVSKIRSWSLSSSKCRLLQACPCRLQESRPCSLCQLLILSHITSNSSESLYWSTFRIFPKSDRFLTSPLVTPCCYQWRVPSVTWIIQVLSYHSPSLLLS